MTEAISKLGKLLVIGGGSIGERHIRCFLATKRVEASLCEIKDDLRQSLAERYSLADTHTNLEEALAGSPDAAVIATPAHLHVEMATRLAEKGIHVLIEKPLSTNLDGVEQLATLVKQQNLLTALAYVYRAHPALQAMREAIHSGRFGAPLQVVVVAGQHFPFYRPAYREIYYRDRATGGGAIQDALTHLINASEWLVGPVTKVVADADHLALEGVEVEDTVHVLARHQDVMASYSLNQHQAPNESTITVVCERGTARFAMHGHQLSWVTKPDEAWQVEKNSGIERDTLFIRQANAFLDAMDGKCEPSCSLDEGIQTLRVNLAILRSVQSGRWETIQT